MSRITANDRVRRLLAIIPWVASHPEGVPIAELCSRFDIDRRMLLGDLTTVSFVGVAPYTPDTQIDVVVEGDRVFVHLPQWFDRPLKLTPEQALALVAAGQSLLAVEGAEPDGPLARALAKLAAATGDPAGDTIAVQVGTGAGDTVATLRDAVSSHRPVRLSYYAYGRDEHTERVVEPHRVHAEGGQLYLWGHCRDAGGDRLFRVDRIDGVTVLDETFTPPSDAGPHPVFNAGPDVSRVVLTLDPAARWVVEQYPVDEVTELDDGRVRVTLAVTAPAWLERLLLRLGPLARVEQADGDPAPAADAARRILARYRQGPGGAGPAAPWNLSPVRGGVASPRRP